ncbi:type I restriction enzyme endonuclease domain-containing protein [Streptomyces hokutonensis]|uniref:type I restriction enzyme endonuclease domain-containing protein n=1 Tax=Streptomyces hokutonensis TaxID=1306990 RepID=UPI0033D156A6
MCTSVELIAKLAGMANEVMDDASRSENFEPPLDWRELAFDNAVGDHTTARSVMGDAMRASVGRELAADVRSKLKYRLDSPANRSSPASAVLPSVS